MRRRYEEAKHAGFTGFAFDSGYEAVSGDATPTVGFVIDARVTQPQAARLQRALKRWFALLDAEQAERKVFDERFGHATVLPTEEVFGPDATGAHRRVEPELEPTARWWLVIPGEPGGADTEEHTWDRWRVLRVRAPVQARSS